MAWFKGSYISDTGRGEGDKYDDSWMEADWDPY
jgi:hypothetical protein